MRYVVSTVRREHAEKVTFFMQRCEQWLNDLNDRSLKVVRLVGLSFRHLW
jgi:hypothetical protein